MACIVSVCSVSLLAACDALSWCQRNWQSLCGRGIRQITAHLGGPWNRLLQHKSSEGKYLEWLQGVKCPPLRVLWEQEVELLVCNIDNVLGLQGMRRVFWSEQHAMECDPILSQNMQLPLSCTRSGLPQNMCMVGLDRMQ